MPSVDTLRTVDDKAGVPDTVPWAPASQSSAVLATNFSWSELAMPVPTSLTSVRSAPTTNVSVLMPVTPWNHATSSEHPPFAWRLQRTRGRLPSLPA